MKLNKQAPHPDDKDAILSAIRWCRRQGLARAGLPYDENLTGPDGCHVTIIAPEGTDPLQLEQAVRESYRETDVTGYNCVLIPVGWFSEADPAGEVTEPEPGPTP